MNLSMTQKTIKEKTDAIPLYTNFAAGWTMEYGMIMQESLPMVTRITRITFCFIQKIHSQRMKKTAILMQFTTLCIQQLQINWQKKTLHPVTGSLLRRRKVQKRLLIVIFMFLPLLLLVVFTYVLFIKMVQFSFYDMKYLGDKVWVGLKNYKEVFSRPDIFGSLFVSVYYMGGTVVQLILALFLQL